MAGQFAQAGDVFVLRFRKALLQPLDMDKPEFRVPDFGVQCFQRCFKAFGLAVAAGALAI